MCAITQSEHRRENDILKIGKVTAPSQDALLPPAKPQAPG